MASRCDARPVGVAPFLWPAGRGVSKPAYEGQEGQGPRRLGSGKGSSFPPGRAAASVRHLHVKGK